MNGSLTENIKLYYWRQGNYEVDFVLERRGKVVGLEVKSGAAGKTAGMQAFLRFALRYIGPGQTVRS